MRLVQLGAAIAVAMGICGPAAADVVVFTETDAIVNGFYPGPFMKVDNGQAYEITITTDAPAFVAPNFTDTYFYNHEEWFEDGSYDLYGSNGSQLTKAYTLAYSDGAWHGSFISTQDTTEYWQNGNVKRTKIGVNYISVGGGFDPAFNGSPVTFTLTAVPEPGTWALMIVGFGLAGVGLRRSKAALATS